METLKNNSEMMKTIVETFLIEETVDLIYDNEKLEKWSSLVKELELTGQSNLAKPDKSPIPFMYLKKSMVNVFETLCPSKVSVKEFDKTPIPLEILSLISLSEKEGYFSEIKIWYDDKTPDPVCLGIIPEYVLHIKGTYTQIANCKFTSKDSADAYILANGLDAESYHASYNDNHYLIGRWADVKQSFEELIQKATARYIAEETTRYEDQIQYYQDQLNKVSKNASTRFN